MKFFKNIKAFLGIFLIIFSIFGIYYWENYGREQFLYTEVLVFNDNIEKNTIITEDFVKKTISILKIDQSNIVDDPVLDINKIIGLETKQYLPKNAQLSNKFFDEPEIVLNKNEYIFSIPKDWLLGYPSSLRRKDKVFFYKVKNTNAHIIDNNNYKQFITNNIADFLLSTTVAYVKDGSNKEVVSVDSERLDGTAKIDEIEVIITKEDAKKLKDAFESGYQFILMYQE